jgi:hypothetical protein
MAATLYLQPVSQGRYFMNEERMLKPAVIGGVLLGILSSLPVISLFNCFCCAWVIGGGIFAAYLYVKDSPIAVTLGRGVAIGLLAGIIGTVVGALFSVPLQLLMDKAGVGVMEQVKQMLEQMPNLPPEIRDRLSALTSRSGFNIILYVIHTLLMLIINGLMAMLGGTIGVAIFEKRKPGDTSIRPPSYEPPANLPPPPPPPSDTPI